MANTTDKIKEVLAQGCARLIQHFDLSTILPEQWKLLKQEQTLNTDTATATVYLLTHADHPGAVVSYEIIETEGVQAAKRLARSLIGRNMLAHRYEAAGEDFTAQGRDGAQFSWSLPDSEQLEDITQAHFNLVFKVRNVDRTTLDLNLLGDIMPHRLLVTAMKARAADKADIQLTATTNKLAAGQPVELTVTTGGSANVWHMVLADAVRPNCVLYQQDGKMWVALGADCNRRQISLYSAVWDKHGNKTTGTPLVFEVYSEK